MLWKINFRTNHYHDETNHPFINKFVIVSFPRSGSNYLCSLLNSHPEILCHYEIFHPKTIYYARSHKELDLITLKQRNRSPKKFLEKLWEINFDYRVIGFKIFTGHNRRAFRLIMKDRLINKILLTRRNRIRTYVSFLIALQTNQWSQVEKNKNKRPEKVIVNAKDLIGFSEKIERTYIKLTRRLTRSKQKYLELVYEDLVTHKEDKRLFDFLGVTYHEMKSHLMRQNPYPLRDIIINYSELKSALRGTKFENDFKEDQLQDDVV